MEKLVHVAGAANDFLHDWTPLGWFEDKVGGSIEKGAGLGEQKLGERMPKNFDEAAARRVEQCRLVGDALRHDAVARLERKRKPGKAPSKAGAISW